MTRQGKLRPKQKTRNLKNKGSDMSDEDYLVSEDDEDEEFKPEEVDERDDDKELLVTKKKKVYRSKMQKGHSAKEKRQKRNLKSSKRTKGKKSIKTKVLRRKNRCRSKEFKDKGHVAHKTKRSTRCGKKRKTLDVDSDYEYTISEEEREQIREASEFCRRLTTCSRSSRSSSSSKMIKVEEPVPSETKLVRTKDREKMVDMKVDVGKQLCGICLSEEGKRTVRGMLNCCSHYFCFTCIMEWSKVESRCPLCKQRFATINRTPQVNSGHDLKDVVITVPKRDQVYQPSVEELWVYLDPYRNVLCTECHQGGDDALMLLCDICDSPAHTYCVGLGREVPEGNWYCDGCRPAAFASSSNLSEPPLSVGTVQETFDLNEVYVPEATISQVDEQSPSDITPSGSAAFTLYERRQIQQQIHLLLNYSRQSERSDGVGPVSGTSIFGSQISDDGVASLQPVPVLVGPQNIHHQRRLPGYTMPSLFCRETLQPRSVNLSRQAQASTSKDHSPCGPSHTGTSATLGHQHHHPCNRMSDAGVNASISPSQFRGASHPSPQKEHVQFLVRRHLKSLSRNSDLDYNTFKYIARTSTHTILASVGLEHRRNEVFAVQTRPLICNHVDSQQTYPVAGQCLSCLDWFIRNVVREVMSFRLPLLFAD